jgi:serine/threonine protein kinase
MEGTDTQLSAPEIEFFGQRDITRVQGNTSLTKGAFGELSLAIRATENGDRRVVVLKTMFQSIQQSNENVPALTSEMKNEIRGLQRLKPHPNIVDLVAVFQSGPSLLLAFEYCPIDLALALEWRKRCILPLLSMHVIKTIMRDLFSALKHAHTNKIVHLDVKSANLLVDSAGALRLCDFGLCKSEDRTDEYKGSAPKGLCTLQYRPPEILLGCQPMRSSVDMYSAGTVLAELLTGRPVFAGRNVIDQLSKIFDVLGTPTKDTWPDASLTPDYSKLAFYPKSPIQFGDILPRARESEHLPNLIESLITLDPSTRLSSTQATNHPWLSDGLASEKQMVEELIPEELQEPLFFTAMQALSSSVPAQVLSLAARRRQFLSKATLF